MPGAVVPHAKIRDAQDRSWTGRLLSRFVAEDLEPDERDEIATTLDRLADPRAEAPLAAILADRARPEMLRRAAAWILRSGDAVDRDSLPALLRDGDPVEQRHALLAMDHGHAELVAAVAEAPDHPLHREAIQAMEWGFESPRFQALKIAALAHADPEVRETAAEVLLWDEPVAAEEPLLRAVADPVDPVAVAAVKALAYYPSRRVLLGLAEVRAAGGERGRAADDAICELSVPFSNALRGAEGARREALLAWMEPVWDILALTEEDLLPDAHEPPVSATPVRQPLDARRLMRDLAELDGAWEDKLRRLRAKPSLVGPADRAQLVPFLVEHPDPLVRSSCGHLLAAWGEHEALIRLTGDARLLVVKAAMFALGKAPQCAAAARCAREHLDRPWVTGTHARETLATYVAHAPAAEAVPLLTERAAEDSRESVRRHAVHALIELRASRELAGLLPLLAAPPRVTWAVHLALLEARRKLGLDGARFLERLREVDDVYVQGALSLAL
jgi:HEAT repeat protein